VISHNLEHVFEVCERIIVLRAGQVEGIVRTS
jgi:ABC-type sugar transport system ATPase subunit